MAATVAATPRRNASLERVWYRMQSLSCIWWRRKTTSHSHVYSVVRNCPSARLRPKESKDRESSLLNSTGKANMAMAINPADAALSSQRSGVTRPETPLWVATTFTNGRDGTRYMNGASSSWYFYCKFVVSQQISLSLSLSLSLRNTETPRYFGCTQASVQGRQWQPRQERRKNRGRGVNRMAHDRDWQHPLDTFYRHLDDCEGKTNDSTPFQVFYEWWCGVWSVLLDVVDRWGVLRYVERRGETKYVFGERESSRWSTARSLSRCVRQRWSGGDRCRWGVPEQ